MERKTPFRTSLYLNVTLRDVALNVSLIMRREVKACKWNLCLDKYSLHNTRWTPITLSFSCLVHQRLPKTFYLFWKVSKSILISVIMKHLSTFSSLPIGWDENVLAKSQVLRLPFVLIRCILCFSTYIFYFAWLLVYSLTCCYKSLVITLHKYTTKNHYRQRHIHLDAHHSVGMSRHTFRLRMSKRKRDKKCWKSETVTNNLDYLTYGRF